VTLIGHTDAQAWLHRAVSSGRLAHAYLLTGPRGVGRRTFAFELAQAVNCLAPEPPERPDHTCQQCSLIQRNVHPDVRLVKRAPDRRAIGLRASQGPQREYADNVEFIQSDAQLRPVMGRRKVYIILGAEELADEAANRLLKTLEEPPSFVLFVLTAVESGGVLPTIVSRCQELRLRPAPRAELAAALVERGTPPERAAALAALAGGRQGWAIAAAADPQLVERQQAAIRQLVEALAGSRLERLARARALAERWSSSPETVRETLRVWLGWWRDVVLVQLGLGERIAHLEPSERTTIAATAAQLSQRQVRSAESAVQQTLLDLEMNVNARLLLDLLLLQLPRTATG